MLAFKRHAGLPAASEYDDTTELYPRLSIAQGKVIDKIAVRYPNALYTAPFTLTPSSDHKTFTFGTDAQGNALMARGWVQIAPYQNAFSGDTFTGWVEGRDFLDEGTQIRMPNNRSYSGTLYCRCVFSPPDITALVAPVLNPPDARDLIAIRAVRDWALEGNQNPALAQAMDKQWAGDFPGLMLSYRRRFRDGGGLIDPARWWLSAADIGSTGS